MTTEPDCDSSEEVDRHGKVLRLLAQALGQFDRATQLRVLEAVCVILGEDGFAADFRKARR